MAVPNGIVEIPDERAINVEGVAFGHRKDSPMILIAVVELRKARNHLSHLYLADQRSKSCRKVASFDRLYTEQIVFEADDEAVWYVGVRRDGVQILERRNLSGDDHTRLFEVGAPGHSLVTDFKLINSEKEIALAYGDGAMRILDIETGEEVGKLVGLQYSPTYLRFYVLGGVAAAWTLLWWLATRRRQEDIPDWSRPIGYVIAVLGFVQGLLLTRICASVHLLDEWITLVALILPSLAVISGIAILCVQKCNKLLPIYGILASVAIIAYTCLTAARLQ